jgi:NADPH:quinone reductase-like Zn-dependent oxidoreductase
VVLSNPNATVLAEARGALIPVVEGSISSGYNRTQKTKRSEVLSTKPWEGDSMAKKWVLITGASGGLGQAVTHKMAWAGWSLALVGRRTPRLKALAHCAGTVLISPLQRTTPNTGRAQGRTWTVHFSC